MTRSQRLSMEDSAALHFGALVVELPSMPAYIRELSFPSVLVEPHANASDPAVFAHFVALDMVADRPWVLRGELAAHRGVAVVRQLSVAAWEAPDADITGTVLRRLRLGLVRDRALAQMRLHAKWVDIERRWLGAPPVTEEERRQALTAAAKATRKPLKRGRKGYAPDHYRGVALKYLELLEAGYGRTAGKGIQAELARVFDRPPATIRDWVSRARTLGFLSEGVQGRVGAVPGPNLYQPDEKERTDS